MPIIRYEKLIIAFIIGKQIASMPETKPIIAIVNVVASASVDQKMDLNDITKKFPDVEYHSDLFPGLVFRLRTPKTATLIFTSRKMVCTGSKSEEIARKAVKTIVQTLRKGGIMVKKDAEVTIQNMVSSINLGGKSPLGKSCKDVT
jgi:transcription initiation factor TFIID TATA-box-binding protein